MPAPLEMEPWPPEVPALAPLPTLPEFAVSPGVEPALPALTFPPFDEVPPFDPTLPFKGALLEAEPLVSPAAVEPLPLDPEPSFDEEPPPREPF